MIQLCSVTDFCVTLTGPSASLGLNFPQVECSGSPALRGAVPSDCQKWWGWGQTDPSQRQNGVNLNLQQGWHGEEILFAVQDKVEPTQQQQHCQGRAKASRRKTAFHFSVCHTVPPEQYKTTSDTYSAHFLPLLGPVLSLLPFKLHCDNINTGTIAYSPFPHHAHSTMCIRCRRNSQVSKAAIHSAYRNIYNYRCIICIILCTEHYTTEEEPEFLAGSYNNLKYLATVLNKCGNYCL